MSARRPLAPAVAIVSWGVMVIAFCLAGPAPSAVPAQEPAIGSTPVIYCSDLFHPPDDPDDWFDLATVFSLSELDLRGIVLDQGEKQLKRPGRIPIELMMAITGKKVSFACGLPNKLRSPSDKGLDQPEKFQEGINLILKVLSESDKKVTMITVGSLRDVCAAFNRKPELLKGKVEKLYISAGNSNGGSEYNVDLDPNAYVGVMRSGLPIYWLPCFGKEPFVSRWQFKQGDLMDGWSLKVQDYFCYGLMNVNPAGVDPVKALDRPIPEEVKKKVWAMDRAMWSTPSFIDAGGRTLAVAVKTVLDPQKGVARLQEVGWRAVPSAKTGGQKWVFEFVPATVTVSDKGLTRFEGIDVINLTSPNMHIFRLEHRLDTVGDYNKAMKQALGDLLKDPIMRESWHFALPAPP